MQTSVGYHYITTVNNESLVNQLAKKVFAVQIWSLINSTMKAVFQIKWDVAAHGWDLYILKLTLGPPKKFQ